MTREFKFEFWMDNGRLILTDHEGMEHDCSDWLEAAGYTIAPIEPTSEQVTAGTNVYHQTHMTSRAQMYSVYKAMIQERGDE